MEQGTLASCHLTNKWSDKGVIGDDALVENRALNVELHSRRQRKKNMIKNNEVARLLSF